MLNDNNHECFDIQQRYMLPVNEQEEGGSTTFIVITCDALFPKKKFYWQMRRWLRDIGVPIVQYCIAANIVEVLACGDYPEGK